MVAVRSLLGSRPSGCGRCWLADLPTLSTCNSSKFQATVSVLPRACSTVQVRILKNLRVTGE